MPQPAELPFTLYFDGNCPLCVREIAFMRWLDRGKGNLLLVDIAAPDFDAEARGKSYVELMARIHGQLPSGEWVEGMEVFRRGYGAVGLGWLMAPSAWPVIGPLFDRLYRFFARNRLRLTGRGDCEGACEIREHAA